MTMVVVHTMDGVQVLCSPLSLLLPPLNLERTPPHASVVASRRKRPLKNIPRNFASRLVLEMISILQLHANRCQRPDFKHSLNRSWIFTHPPRQRQQEA